MPRFRLLIAILLAFALLAAACGDDDDGAAADDAAADDAAADDAAADDAAADDAAADDGAACDTGERTIGLAAITLQSPAVTAMINELERGAELLGWSVEILNADGDPAKMAEIVAAFANQNVDAIVNIAISPAQAQEGMQIALDKGIPMIGIGTPLLDPQGLVAGTFSPSEEDMSDQLVDQMFEDYAGQTGEIFVMTTTGIIASEIRADTVIQATEGTDLVVAEVFETDLAAAVQNTQTGVANSLRANPDINIIWGVHDFQFTVSLQTIESQSLQDASVYSYYPPAEALALLREWSEGDAPLAVADSPVGFSSWFPLDSLVTKWCNPDQEDWLTDVSVKPFPIVVITPENVPDGDAWPFEPFEPFFADRWEDQGVTLN